MRHPKRTVAERELEDLFGLNDHPLIRKWSAEEARTRQRKALKEAVAFLAGIVMVVGVIVWCMVHFIP